MSSITNKNKDKSLDKSICIFYNPIVNTDKEFVLLTERKTHLLWFFFLTLITLSLFYSIISFLLTIGTLKLKRTQRKINKNNNHQKISVLVPARDEELHIANCLESLIVQDYPKDKYEIIVINDRSSDHTLDIIRNYKSKYNNIKIINIDKNLSNLTGKQNALNYGIKHCEGEIILNVDADCIAGPSWLSKTIQYFTEEVGFIIGFTTTYGSSFLSKLQGLDMIFLMDASAGSLGLNIPVSCMGSNIGYRKSVIDELGHSIEYTITEDTDLLQKVAKMTKWKIAVPYDESAVILTYAEENFKSFISQRIRWTIGGQIAKLWTLFPLYLIFAFNFLLIIAFFLSFFSKNILFAFLFACLLKMIVDFVRCLIVCYSLNRTDLIRFFLPYQAFMILYSIIIGFGSFWTRKVIWKGEIYTKKSVIRKSINTE